MAKILTAEEIAKHKRMKEAGEVWVSWPQTDGPIYIHVQQPGNEIHKTLRLESWEQAELVQDRLARAIEARQKWEGLRSGPKVAEAAIEHRLVDTGVVQASETSARKAVRTSLVPEC